MKSNNLRLALLFSLLLHLFLIIIFILLEQKQKEEEPKKVKIGNVQLKEYQQPKPPTAPPPSTSPATPEQKPTPQQQPKPAPKPEPKPEPPKPKPEPKKEPPKEIKKPIQKPEEKPAKKTVPVQKLVKKEEPKEIPKKAPEPKPASKSKEVNATQQSSLGSFLSKKSAPSLNDIANSFVDQKIEKLYGKEFGTFTEEQKEFIRDNLSTIGSITQRHLKYPSLAGELQQKGTNVVQFDLHPNGDISDLKLIGKTGYSMLDKNSIKTIEIAYKDYPRPKTTTKIKIFVQYILY